MTNHPQSEADLIALTFMMENLSDEGLDILKQKFDNRYTAKKVPSAIGSILHCQFQADNFSDYDYFYRVVHSLPSQTNTLSTAEAYLTETDPNSLSVISSFLCFFDICKLAITCKKILLKTLRKVSCERLHVPRLSHLNYRLARMASVKKLVLHANMLVDAYMKQPFTVK